MKWLNQTNQATANLNTRVPAPSEGGDIQTIQLFPSNGANFPVADFYIYFPAADGVALETPEYVYIATRAADTLFAGPDPFGISANGRAAINPGRWPASAHSVGARLELRSVAEIIKQLQQQIDSHTHNGTTGNGGVLTDIAGVANIVLTNGTGSTVSTGDVLLRSGNLVVASPTDGYLSNLVVVVVDPTGATPNVSTYAVPDGASVNVRAVGLVSVKMASPCAQGDLLRTTTTLKLSPLTGAQTGAVATATEASTPYAGGHWTRVFLHNRGIDVVTLAGSQDLINKRLFQPTIFSGGTTASPVTFPNITSPSTLVDTASTQNLTGKTLVNPIVQVSGDVAGDTYYRGASGILARVPVGTVDQINTLDSSGRPYWATVPRYMVENMVTNGEFRVCQRGFTFDPQNGTVLADRWVWLQASGTSNMHVQVFSGASVASGTPASSGLTFTTTLADTSISATDFYGVSTTIEGNDIGQIVNGLAISFWQYSQLGGIHCMSVRNAAFNRSYIIEYNLPAAQWTRVTAAVPAPPSGTWNYDTSAGMVLTWVLAAGSNWFGSANTWNSTNSSCTANQINDVGTLNGVSAIANVNVIPGTVAREIQSRGIATELLRCQRYYQRLFEPGTTYFSTGQAYGATTIVAYKQFYTYMRTTPTITVTNPSSAVASTAAFGGAPVSSISPDYITPYSSRFVIVTSTGGLAAGNATTISQASGSCLIEAKAEF